MPVGDGLQDGEAECQQEEKKDGGEQRAGGVEREAFGEAACGGRGTSSRMRETNALEVTKSASCAPACGSNERRAVQSSMRLNARATSPTTPVVG